MGEIKDSCTIRSALDPLTRQEHAWISDPNVLIALQGAFQTKLFDRLHSEPNLVQPSHPLATLTQAGLLERGCSGVRLSPQLAAVLDRDAAGFAAITAFSALALADCLDHAAVLDNPSILQKRARTFRFFRYDRAMGTGAAQIEDTEPWVAYVAALSLRETPSLVPHLPVIAPGRLLEIGGNVGRLTAALMAKWPGLQGTVLDLPAVCHLGARMTPSVGFLPADAREVAWPKAECVLFKSVLHDWQEPAARAFIRRAAEAIPLGGRVIICERGSVESSEGAMDRLDPVNLIFSAFYRSPALYERWLSDVGLTVLTRLRVDLDMPFFIVSAERTAP